MNKVLSKSGLLIAGLVTVMVEAGQAQALPPVPVVPVPGAPVANVGGPKIEFATPVYDFGKIGAGHVVKYSYIFTNTGTATLEVSDVRPSCGCTPAGTWDRKVEPGQTGSVPIQFNSANFTGPIFKTITVTCNDPQNPVTMLQLKGTVWKPIDVVPAYAVFNPVAGSQSNETRIVRITNNTDDSLKLAQPDVANKAFTAEIKTIRDDKEYEVHIQTVPPLSYGTIQSPITIKTSSTNMPVITINAIAMVQQPIMVMPAQIMLPAGPAGQNMRMGVTVRNNGASSITVSNPAVSVPGVETTLQTVQTGRIYNVMLSFPVGFELPPGQRAELTLQTSDPQFSVVKVPIFQSPRPAFRPGISPAVRPAVTPGLQGTVTPVRPAVTPATPTRPAVTPPVPVRPPAAAAPPVRPLSQTNRLSRVPPPLPPGR